MAWHWQVGVGGSHEDRVSHARAHKYNDWQTCKTYSTLQLLQRPQVVSDIRDRFYGDALVHLAHLLRAEFRDPHADCELLPLGLERNGCPSWQRRVRGREPPAGGRQAGTHHVCAGEEEADRAAVDADVCEDEGICEAW